jgi:hypothetical protein
MKIGEPAVITVHSMTQVRCSDLDPQRTIETAKHKILCVLIEGLAAIDLDP